MERVHTSPCPFSLTQTRARLMSFVETQLINSGWLKRLGVEVLRTVTTEEAAATDQVAVDELQITREAGRNKQRLEDASASTRVITDPCTPPFVLARVDARLRSPMANSGDWKRWGAMGSGRFVNPRLQTAVTAPFRPMDAHKLHVFHHRKFDSVPTAIAEMRCKIRSAVDARVQVIHPSVMGETGAKISSPLESATFLQFLTVDRSPGQEFTDVKWTGGDCSPLRGTWVESAVSLREFELMMHASRCFWRRDNVNTTSGRSRRQLMVRWTRLCLKDLSEVQRELARLAKCRASTPALGGSVLFRSFFVGAPSCDPSIDAKSPPGHS
jgi:hypothetical protein